MIGRSSGTTRHARRAGASPTAPGGARALLLLPGLLFAAGAAAAGVGGQTIDVQTSEGPFTIELFDHPDIESYATAFFQQRIWLAGGGFFHRSDKTLHCDDRPETCSLCVCSGGSCQDSGEVCTREGETFYVANDDTQLASVLHAGRFAIDDQNVLRELEDWPTSRPDLLLSQPGTFSNVAWTVALVRDVGTSRLTAEWIINLEDNSEQFDDAEDDPPGRMAYLVIGRVVLGREVVQAIASQKTFDASQDPDVLDQLPGAGAELHEVPVYDDFDPEPSDPDELTEPCRPDAVPPDDYPACLTPACPTPAQDGLSCEDPRCLALVELTPEEQAIVDAGGSVPRFCDGPVQPAFPFFLPEPEPGLLQGSALFALAGVAARRRRRRPR